MVLRQQDITPEQFDEFIQQADPGDQIFEFIGGEIVEVPSNPYASEIAQLVSFFIRLFIRETGLAGHVTGADGGYMVAGERYAPDVAFISAVRQPELVRKGYNPNPPDLAVEVISDESSAKELDQLMLKISNYMAAGTVVWVFYPVTHLVRVHIVGQPVQIIGKDGAVDGGDVLPGFTLSLSDIFK